jgi:RNA-directed DNA polymerase
MKESSLYDITRLRAAYLALKREVPPGVDGETRRHYGETLEARPRLGWTAETWGVPSEAGLSVYISKEGPRQRPLGVPTLKDEIVQLATIEVLNANYETDFLGFS